MVVRIEFVLVFLEEKKKFFCKLEVFEWKRFDFLYWVTQAQSQIICYYIFKELRIARI